MGAGLKSASTNQTLRLALKAIVLALLVFWLRSSGVTFGFSLLFLIAFAIFYTSPSLGNSKYLSSAIVLVAIPFFVPVVPGPPEAIFIGAWASVFFFLLSTKNLLLLRRRNIYGAVHFAIVAILALLLVQRFSLTSQAVIFTAMLFIFREFYTKFSEEKTDKNTLVAALEAFILIEIAWMLAFLSVKAFMGAAFLTLFVLIFHDTTLHRTKGTLTKQIAIRNSVIFAALAITIIALSSLGTIF